jgi:hypothetical protein
MSYSDIVATIAMIISISAVPASGYLSYHFAIRGEKRKEFNSVADLLRVKLRKQISLLDQNIYPASGKDGIDDEEFDALMDVARSADLDRISKLVDAYRKALKDCSARSEYGHSIIKDPDNLIKAIDNLMPYVDRK